MSDRSWGNLDGTIVTTTHGIRVVYYTFSSVLVVIDTAIELEVSWALITTIKKGLIVIVSVAGSAVEIAFRAH